MFKERIVLVVSGIIVLVLFIGVASFYAYDSYTKNQELKEDQNSEENTVTKNPENDDSNIDPKTEDEVVSPYTLIGYTGDVFGAKVPEGWSVSDNESGIEVTDPNDPSTGSSGMVAVGWYGYQTPDGFIDYMLQAIGAQSISYVNESDQEEIVDSATGLTWQMKSKTFTFTKDGKSLKAKASAGVLNGYGQFMGMLVAFQTTPDKWAAWAPTLERIATSVTIINPQKAGGIDKVKLPTAADLKNDSSPLMESWEYRNKVDERASHEWSDAIMGQETDLYSPSTNQKYTRPLSDYDPTIGGYRNPDNLSETLIDSYDR